MRNSDFLFPSRGANIRVNAASITGSGKGEKIKNARSPTQIRFFMINLGDENRHGPEKNR
jgi:hypothetical protein